MAESSSGFRKRIKRSRGGRDWDQERARDPNRPGRHPPHLKGKEIGLFYARRNRENKDNNSQICLGKILLSDKKKEEIHKILQKCNIQEISNDASYNHVEDSAFKRDFLRIRSGDILNNLKSSKSSLEDNPQMNQALYEYHQEKQSSNQLYKKMLARRQNLPSFKKKDELLHLINKNQVVVVSGETGCGKTTQVAQFILDNYIENKKASQCRIICTQPRRISAISVAERVAEERGERLGLSVGYSIRLESKWPRERGSISFCTTGIVLKLMENDPSLSNVSHIILDEIHERDINSDFLLALLKFLITKRSDLKVILMSATLNSESFSKYYNDAPHINIPGFTYPVKEYFLEDVLERTKFHFPQNKTSREDRFNRKSENSDFVNFIEPHVRLLEKGGQYSKHVLQQLRNPESEKPNLDLVLALLIDICHKERGDGSILVFLTGFMEISSLNTKIENCGKFPRNRYIIIPLHSQMPTVDQHQIFDPAPPGKRKIIISTNIAETSITIDDVVYVIDCGKIKMKTFDAETNIQSLLPQWVALANASQRKGRAGRVQAGVCYHMFSKARYMILEQYQKPEILRTRLDSVILIAKILQLGQVEKFFSHLIDPPDPQTIQLSLDLLKRLNALDDDEKLTPLGYHLARLPISPQMGKMILFGAIFSCLDPILSIAAALDFKDPFQMPLGKEAESDMKKRELSNGWNSDHLLLHHAIHLYEQSNDKRRFCWEYFLSSATLKLLVNMKKQFMDYLIEMNFVNNSNPKSSEYNINSDNLSLVKAVVCAGLYPNVARIKPGKHSSKIRSLDNGILEFHPKSILLKVKNFDSKILVYHLLLKSSQNFVHDATVVHPLPVVFFGDKFQHKIENGKSFILISDKMKFKCTESTTAVIKELREKLNWFLEHKIAHPGVVDWKTNNQEIKLLEAIMELITSEDVGDIDSDAYEDFD